MSNPTTFRFQVDEKSQREQFLIEDTQKSQHSNFLVETDEDGDENLLQEQEPCDHEEPPAREPSSEIPWKPPEALQSSPTQMSQRQIDASKDIPHVIGDEQATWENKARTLEGGTESVEDPMQELTTYTR